MKIQATVFLLPLLVGLIFFSTCWASDDLDNNNNNDSSSTKLSTSLLVGHDYRNQTSNNPETNSNSMKILDISNIQKKTLVEQKPTVDNNPMESSINSSQELPEKNAYVFDDNDDDNNNNFENVTKELVVPKDIIEFSADDVLNESEDIPETLPEALPEALELRSLRGGSRRNTIYRVANRPPNSNRRNVFPVEAPLRSKRPNRRPTEVIKREPTENDCTFFTKTVCLETANYPHEAIMQSIRGNKDMISALLTDYNGQDSEHDYRKSLPLDTSRFENRYENKYENNELKRRSDYNSASDNTEEGFTCPSQIMYARPQLARAVSGTWKYIINTGEHTQTLRLEKCSKPRTSCSFISENYRSSCTQVYNYHRLLTWESGIGLHMDIFKVPSCCSCHVHGYTELYPPIQKDPPRSHDEDFPGADFATDQNNDGTFERPTSYLTKYKPSSSFDNNFVSGGNKPIIDAGTSNRPSFTFPGRVRPKKPSSSSSSSSSSSRPFDKLPQQHAPNTRAPGYKGPVVKKVRPIRNNRPFRRESNQDMDESTSTTSSLSNWLSQSYNKETDTRLHNVGFDEEYQDQNRRINYDYHPIIDFFKPEASMLKSPQALTSQSSTSETSSESSANDNSWKPMISS